MGLGAPSSQSISCISLSPFPAPRRHDVWFGTTKDGTNLRLQTSSAIFPFIVIAHMMRPVAEGRGEGRADVGLHNISALCKWSKKPARRPCQIIAVRDTCSVATRPMCRVSLYRRDISFQTSPGLCRSRETVRQRGAQWKLAPVIG